MKKQFLTILLVIGVLTFVNAQESPAAPAIRAGNAFYQNNQYADAEASYRKALAAAPTDKMVKFNLASAMFRQGNSKEASALFSELQLAAETDPDIKEKAYYNSGVILAKENKLEESAEAFKQALRMNPGDEDARENLQKVLSELRKRQPKKEKESEKKNQKQKEKPRPKLNRRQVEQQLKLLELKEQEVKERLQQKSNIRGGAQVKDW